MMPTVHCMFIHFARLISAEMDRSSLGPANKTCCACVSACGRDTNPLQRMRVAYTASQVTNRLSSAARLEGMVMCAL